MDFFREIFGKDSEKDNILEENRQLKAKRKHTSRELDKIREEKDELATKYINLLEEKAKGFDQYLYYHDLYAETQTVNKEQKKEIAELKCEIRRLNEELDNNSKSKKGGKNAKKEK